MTLEKEKNNMNIIYTITYFQYINPTQKQIIPMPQITQIWITQVHVISIK